MKLSKEIIMAAQKKWHRDYLMKNTIKYPAVSYRVPRKQELARKLRNELQSLQRDLERAEEGLSDACRRYNLAKELPIPSQCLDSKQCKFSFVLVDKNHVKKYVARFSFRNGSRCNITWRIA